MGAGIRKLFKIDSAFTPGAVYRIHQYSQQLIHESQSFDTLPNGDLEFTGSAFEFDTINRKVVHFIGEHQDELFKKLYDEE